MIGNSPEASNFNRLFLKLNRFICNQIRSFPDNTVLGCLSNAHCYFPPSASNTVTYDRVLGKRLYSHSIIPDVPSGCGFPRSYIVWPTLIDPQKQCL